MSNLDADGFSTDLAHFGEDEKHAGAVIPPIYQNTTFVFDTMEELHEALLTRRKLSEPPGSLVAAASPSHLSASSLRPIRIPRMRGTF